MPIDPHQLALLIETHAGSLRLWIRSRCASCDDVVQDAFCRLAVIHPCPENPVAWLYRVCRNLAEKQRVSDSRRRRRESALAKQEADQRTYADPLEIADSMTAVANLDEQLRDVLVARIWGQLSLEETAAVCGISSATAFRRYEKALQILREVLAPKYEEPKC